MDRQFTNILCDDVNATAVFYQTVLGMRRHFDSDWFVILTHDDIDGLEYGLLQKDHDIVPEVARGTPSGVIVTFVVADCDAIHQKALAAEAAIIEAPTDMPYGQRRMLLRDPAGTLLDVSAPTAPLTQ